MIAAAAQQSCVLLIYRESRYSGWTDFNLPVIVDLAYEYIRDNVLGLGWANGQAGFRIAAPDQRERVMQVLFGGSQAAAQLAVIPAGDQIEVVFGEFDRQCQTRS